MGSCVSTDKNQSDSTMKMRFLLCCSTKKFLMEKSVNDEYPVSDFKSQLSPLPPVTSFRDVGSKEETFFDSQAWLESDVDDDFLSVDGDFTPSRGNTPNYQKSSITATPRLAKSPFMDRAPNSKFEPSSTYKKKRLSELFQESFGGDEFSNDQNIAHGNLDAKATKSNLLQKSPHETPCISVVHSVCSSEKSPDKDTKPEKEKLPGAVQCCLPSLIQSLRPYEKTTTNSVNNGGG